MDLNKPISLFLLTLLVGCRIPKLDTVSGKATNILEGASKTSETLTVLSAVGGLCLIAGMVLLVISRGQRGWYPVIGGIILVILNYMVGKYDDYVFYPLVVCTGLISGAWTYRTVRQILLEKKTK
jgi:hypothetical protein